MVDLKHVLTEASTYLHHANLDILQDAYDFISDLHAGKVHANGEEYVAHSLQVASTLAAMRLDLATITAGLLHDALLGEGVTLELLEKKFGRDVARIVDGTTRITSVRYNSQLQHQAENIRKLLLAMGRDIRVLLVKLADRLQDMYALGASPADEQERKARESMDLYAPLASRLGIDWLKRELEDLAFRYLYPADHYSLTQLLESSLEERQAYVEEVIAILQEKLNAADIQPLRVIGRPKHAYSIYKKLIRQNIALEKVYDKVAFRIIVRTVKECYEALGIVHGSWTPVPSRIKDFISSPKSNNYQSLHTTVSGPKGLFIEIQIRTEEMDHIAQEGVAAHWAYKEGQSISATDARLVSSLKDLVHELQDVEDPDEFMATVRAELGEPDVYALTPTGEVRELPSGSTPVDFAYSIHTAVGDSCVGARVNDHLVPLRHILKTGDVVEIITKTGQKPKRSWLQFVKTGKARTGIRNWLGREEKAQLLKFGRDICERELRKHSISLKRLSKTGELQEVLSDLRSHSIDDMMVKLGAGSITPESFLNAVLRVAIPEKFQEAERQLQEELDLANQQRLEENWQEAEGTGTSSDLEGIEGMLVKMSKCCHPIPGDAIRGFITIGSGLAVHRADCPQLLATDPARWMDISWSKSLQTSHLVEITLHAEDRRNLLADISSSISADGANIKGITSFTTGENIAVFRIKLEVRNMEHFQRLRQHLLQVSEVMEVRRH